MEEFLDELEKNEKLKASPTATRVPLFSRTTIHCLAIRVQHLPDGEIDDQELDAYLTSTAGPSSWLMLSVWLFARPPQTAPDIQTVPVIMTETVASRVKRADLENGRQQRVFSDHVVGAVELRGWRFITETIFAQPTGRGMFSWEVVCGEGHQK